MYILYRGGGNGRKPVWERCKISSGENKTLTPPTAIISDLLLHRFYIISTNCFCQIKLSLNPYRGSITYKTTCRKIGGNINYYPFEVRSSHDQIPHSHYTISMQFHLRRN